MKFVLQADVQEIISLLYEDGNIGIIAGAECFDYVYLGVASMPKRYMINVQSYRVSEIKNFGL